jgi:methylmalonyl-CoA mutase
MIDPASAPSEAAWRKAAEAGLGGASFERALVGTAPEGFAVEPLYLARHLPPHDQALFDAGAGGPVVAQLYSVGDPVRAHSEIVEDLGRGVEALWLRLEDEADARVKLGVALAGVAPPTPILLDAGEQAVRLSAHAKQLGFLSVGAQLDPFATMLRRGDLARGWAAAFDEAVAASEVQSTLGRVVAVSPAAIVEAGGDLGQAIGFALAGAAEWARAFDARGAVGRVAASLAVVVSPGTDVFRGIALLRALTLGFAKLWPALGVPGDRPLFVGVGSRRALSALDAHTNMIRASLESFSLITGGADIVAARAFDEIAVTKSALGRRLAKNTPLVLTAESQLASVRDPAKGSYYVEALTDALARAGWAELARIEGEGGLAASLDKGAFQSRVAHASEARARDITRRKRVLVGTSDFATAAAPLEISQRRREPPRGELPALSGGRDAEPFEALRLAGDAIAARRGKPLSALLVGLGPAATYRPREAFVRRLFELCGFAVDLFPDPNAEAATEAAWFESAIKSRAPDALCVVGADDAYPIAAESVVGSAKRAGVPAILLAGKPGALAEPLKAAGLTSSVALGDDMVALLGSVLAASGGAA